MKEDQVVQERTLEMLNGYLQVDHEVRERLQVLTTELLLLAIESNSRGTDNLLF